MSPILKRLEEIEARLNAATPGPWRVLRDWQAETKAGEKYETPIYCGVQLGKAGGFTLPVDANAHHNTFLIAHAPTDLTLLLKIVEEQRKALDECEEDLCHHEDALKRLSVNTEMHRDWCSQCSNWCYRDYESPVAVVQRRISSLLREAGR